MKIALIFFISTLPNHGYSQAAQNSRVPVKTSQEIVEDYGVAEISVTGRALLGLGIEPAATPDEVRKALVQHGVNLRLEDKACLRRNDSTILLKSHTLQWEQLERVLTRLNKRGSHTSSVAAPNINCNEAASAANGEGASEGPSARSGSLRMTDDVGRHRWRSTFGCRQPEGPSTALVPRFAQDDRRF